MKARISISTFLLITSIITAQNQYDRFWLTGLTKEFDLSLFYGGTLIDFGTEPPVLTPVHLPTSYGHGTTLICDKNGIPKMSSDGCNIFNFGGDLIENGDSINYPGLAWEIYCDSGGFDYPQFLAGRLILPDPANENRYWYFHLREDGKTYQSTVSENSLVYSLIDMSANNSKGQVLKKNTLLVKDSIQDCLTAVRHGNGRDWWLFSTSYGSDKSFLFLLDPKGIHGPFITRTLGNRKIIPDDIYTFAFTVFSPNGKRFAYIDDFNGVQVASFDRCSGQFYCPINIPFPRSPEGYSLDFSEKDFVYSPGIAISPNSRFLYVSTGIRIFQFDLDAKDIAASRVQVGEYDGYKAELETTIYQGQLAPNGKIYWTCGNGAHVMHVIHHPDEKGLACQFENHGLNLFTENGYCVTIYPNFRLLDFANSPCDTLGIDNPNAVYKDGWVNRLHISPNPATEKTTIQLPDEGCSQGDVLRVYTITGQVLRELELSGIRHSIDVNVQDWPSGCYPISLISGKKILGVGRLIVLNR